MVISTVQHYIMCTDRIMESVCTIIRSADPQCNAGMWSLKQMLLQLWQKEVTLSIHCNVAKKVL